MTYREAEQYLNGLPRFTAKHSLADTQRCLDALGAPDRRMRILHVAGTNGKGSVCCYLSSILRCAGYRTALFTSPHLVSTRERMAVDGEWIPEDEFVRKLEQVRAAVQGIGEELPTYFEFLFLMAMLWFAEQGAEIAVLETGLGGRLDATNAVRKKELAVITRIGLDHMQYLGNTVAAIAGEKAGILRPAVPAVCLAEPEEARAAIAGRAEELSAPLFSLRKEDWQGRSLPDRRIDFSFCYRYDLRCSGGKLPCPEESPASPGQALRAPALSAVLPTAALYQAENAALAVCAALLLMKREDSAAGSAAGLLPAVSREAIRAGLMCAHWPARMDEVLPGVFIDGGHNEDGIRAFLESAAAIPLSSGGERRLLFSAVRDKQYESMARRIAVSGLFRKIVLVPLESERGISGEELRAAAATMRAAPGNGEAPELSVESAANQAFFGLIRSRSAADQVYAAGSLYLAGELLEGLSRAGLLTGEKQNDQF
ncbi:bifunctional folylpolyglutamate synthase/dihydrofolate synthase [Lachnoclostridium sp. Marseille-P6806]|uniref:bifunctional folylpolyglutamate synthase/dihydrofolate synthase n=1 Tax=Lachnoclostridium sp. Marseille-P6806 TaxID=2364793 RepID=UPI0013EF5B2E|nr:Mur ligase family protein [Lachnoclostridium sp. Marseille-P6806]